MTASYEYKFVRRLVQIFAPDLNFGAAKYYELVFERERP